MDKALCFGLTKVDPARYNGWDGDCPGCDLDAKRIYKLFESYGWGTALSLNNQCTREAVVQTIEHEASTMSAGDQLVIYISCHGGQTPDMNGDEDDGQDETICLWDGQMLDDDLLDVWNKIPRDVDVIYITDSCNSRTNFKMKPRSIGGSVPVVFSGSLIHLAGCDDGKSSYGGDDGGVFTNALLASFDPEYSWRVLYDYAKSLMPRNQLPFIEHYGDISDALKNGPIIRNLPRKKKKDFWDNIADAISNWWKSLKINNDGTGAVTVPPDDADNNPPDDTPVPSEKHIASFLFDNAKERAMNLLGMSQDHWRAVVDRCFKNHSNTFLIYTQCEADGGNAGFSLWKSNKIGREINDAMVGKLNDIIGYIRKRDPRAWIELWLRADDGPNFNKLCNRTTPDLQKNAQAQVVKLFDATVNSYCMGLEWDEYESENNMKMYIRHMRQHTDKEITVHFRKGPQTDLANRILAEITGPKGFHMQWSLGLSPSKLEDSVRRERTKLATGTKCYANEYHQSNDTAESRALGDAALRGGANGVGGGANV
jgi:hypothetical protein